MTYNGNATFGQTTCCGIPCQHPKCWEARSRWLQQKAALIPGTQAFRQLTDLSGKLERSVSVYGKDEHKPSVLDKKAPSKTSRKHITVHFTARKRRDEAEQAFEKKFPMRRRTESWIHDDKLLVCSPEFPVYMHIPDLKKRGKQIPESENPSLTVRKVTKSSPAVQKKLKIKEPHITDSQVTSAADKRTSGLEVKAPEEEEISSITKDKVLPVPQRVVKINTLLWQPQSVARRDMAEHSKSFAVNTARRLIRQKYAK